MELSSCWAHRESWEEGPAAVPHLKDCGTTTRFVCVCEWGLFPDLSAFALHVYKLGLKIDTTYW